MQNPFKALGDLNAMRKQAMQIQSMLEKEEFDIVSGNIKIVITGNQNVKLVEIDGMRNVDLERAFNEAIKRSQRAAAGKLQEMTRGMNMQ
jgi:DNA-binding protein YbaB